MFRAGCRDMLPAQAEGLAGIIPPHHTPVMHCSICIILRDHLASAGIPPRTGSSLPDESKVLKNGKGLS